MRAKGHFNTALVAGLLACTLGAFLVPPASAQNCWRSKNGHVQCANGNHYYYDKPRNTWVDYKTGKVLKGGLIGAGIGVGTSLLLDRNIGQGALLGAGLGAGTQAVRYSSTLHRHPIVKTAAYGAMTGVGVNALRRDSLGEGALWGAGIGAGLGALGHLK